MLLAARGVVHAKLAHGDLDAFGRARDHAALVRDEAVNQILAHALVERSRRNGDGQAAVGRRGRENLRTCAGISEFTGPQAAARICAECSSAIVRHGRTLDDG
jgi:hypothetical protein